MDQVIHRSLDVLFGKVERIEGDEVELGSLQLPDGYAEIAAPVRI